MIVLAIALLEFFMCLPDELSMSHLGRPVFLFFYYLLCTLLMTAQDAGAHEYEHYLKANPTHRSGLNDLNKAIVKSLNMNVYYTANEVETRAWYGCYF